MSKPNIHRIPVETCSVCGAVNRFKTISTRAGATKRVSYVRCRVCGAKATFVYYIPTGNGDGGLAPAAQDRGDGK